MMFGFWWWLTASTVIASRAAAATMEMGAGASRMRGSFARLRMTAKNEARLDVFAKDERDGVRLEEVMALASAAWARRAATRASRPVGGWVSRRECRARSIKASGRALGSSVA